MTLSTRIPAGTVLTCGHPVPADPPKMTTGYAYDAEGNTYCFPCSDDRERAEMANSQTHVAYVSSDEKEIQTWPGGTLARITDKSKSRTGWHGSYVFRYWAVAPDGSHWYGANGGPGMVINLRRIKGDA